MSYDERRYVARAARNARLEFFGTEQHRERERRERALARQPAWNDYAALLRMTSDEAETLMAGVLQRLSTTPSERPFSSAETSQAASLAGTLIRAGKVDGHRTEKRLVSAARRHARLQGAPEKGAEDFALEQLARAYWAKKLVAILEAQERRR